MVETGFKSGLKVQMRALQDLLVHLEDAGGLTASDYTYCQATLRKVVKQLGRLERLAAGSPAPGPRDETSQP